MMKVLLVLWLAAAAATSDPTACPVCLRGTCYIATAFYDNIMQLEHVEKGRVTMDYNRNFIYFGRDSVLNKINLDDKTIEVIPTVDDIDIKNIGVDAVTGDVYYIGTRIENQYTIYKYQPKTNETEILTIPRSENNLPPSKLWVYNGTVYYNCRFVNNLRLQKGMNRFDGTTVKRVSSLENMLPVDIVFDNFGNFYTKANGKLYKLMIKEDGSEDGSEELTQIAQNFGTFYVVTAITGNKNGELYVTDTVRNLIYQLDESTKQVEKIGAYVDPTSEFKRVLFDKNNNVIIDNNISTTYYKASTEKCVINSEEYRVKITKV